MTPEQERKTMYEAWFKTPKLFNDLLTTGNVRGTLGTQFPLITPQSLDDMTQRINALRLPANDTQKDLVTNMFSVGNFNAAHSTPALAPPPPDWF